MPAGYIIAQINVSDAAAFEEYRALVPGTIKQYGGEYIIRGGKQEDIEGSPNPRTVVIRFDSFEQARKWYYSDEYEKPKALRHAASTCNAVLVEGV